MRPMGGDYFGLVLRGLSSFAAANHFCAGNIAFFIDEIKITFLLFDADLGNFFGASASFVAAGHFGAGNITFFIDKIEIPFLLFNSDFCDFFSHSIHPLSYVPILMTLKNCFNVLIADKTAR